MLGDACVDTVVARARAAGTPAHDADLIGTAVAVVGDQRSAAVALAGVLGRPAPSPRTAARRRSWRSGSGPCTQSGDRGNGRLQQPSRASEILLAVRALVAVHRRTELERTEPCNAHLRPGRGLRVRANRQRQTWHGPRIGPLQLDQGDVAAGLGGLLVAFALEDLFESRRHAHLGRRRDRRPPV